jgi:hypothetical protein
MNFASVFLSAATFVLDLLAVITVILATVLPDFPGRLSANDGECLHIYCREFLSIGKTGLF